MGGKAVALLALRTVPFLPTLRSGRKGGFTDYAMQFIKMIYKPLQIHLIHFLLISEKVFSLPFMTSNFSFKKYLGMGISNCC